MKWHSFFLFMAASAPVWAQTTYICQLHGKAAYTTVKQNAHCHPAQINGLSEASSAVFAPPVAVASQVALPSDTQSASKISLDANDPIAQIWYEHEYGSYDRTPILPPPAPRPSVAVSKPDAPATHSIIAPSRATHKPKIVAARPVAVVYHAPSAPVLSRRDILSQEIEREQMALKIVKNQLASAQKRRDTVNIQKLNDAMRDRLANVASLQRELQR